MERGSMGEAEAELLAGSEEAKTCARFPTPQGTSLSAAGRPLGDRGLSTAVGGEGEAELRGAILRWDEPAGSNLVGLGDHPKPAIHDHPKTGHMK
jgi:hypothetical protein